MAVIHPVTHLPLLLPDMGFYACNEGFDDFNGDGLSVMRLYQHGEYGDGEHGSRTGDGYGYGLEDWTG